MYILLLSGNVFGKRSSSRVSHIFLTWLYIENDLGERKVVISTWVF